MRVLREKRAMKSEVRVAAGVNYKCSLQSHTVPPLRKTRSMSSSTLVISLGACMLWRSYPLLALATAD